MELPDEKTIILRKPLVTAQGTVDALPLREPTAGELAKFTKAMARDGNVDATLHLIALVSGIDKPFLDKLGARDFSAASDYLSGFINGSPSAGETA